MKIKLLATSLLLSYSAITMASSITNATITSLPPTDNSGMEDAILGIDHPVMTPGSVNASNKKHGKLDFGIKLGFNVTTNPGSLSPSWLFANPGLMPTFGVAVSYPINDRLGAAMDVLYSGDVFTNVFIPNQRWTYLNRLNYIDVPVKLQIKIVENFTGFVGAAFSFLTSNSSYVENPILNENTQPVENGNVRHFVPAFTFGLNYRISNINIGGRLTCGSKYYLENNPPRNTTVGQITIGYSFIAAKQSEAALKKFQNKGEE